MTTPYDPDKVREARENIEYIRQHTKYMSSINPAKYETILAALDMQSKEIERLGNDLKKEHEMFVKVLDENQVLRMKHKERP